MILDQGCTNPGCQIVEATSDVCMFSFMFMGPVIVRWLPGFMENLSSRAADSHTVPRSGLAVDRRLHTTGNWVQFQENSVEYSVHVVGTDTRVFQNIFVFPSQLSLPRWSAIRDQCSGPGGGRIYSPQR
jgi:hypothetical protein